MPEGTLPDVTLPEVGRPGLRRGKLIRSAGVRFGLIYAGLFAASAVALAVFLWWSTAGLLDRQTDAAINADTVGLAERYSDGGLPALEESIEQRLADNIEDDAIYLLATPEMAKLAGQPDGNHTVDPQVFVDTLCGAITRHHMEARAEVQSFDFRTLILVEQQFPKIPTYYLTGDARTLSSPLVPEALRQP